MALAGVPELPLNLSVPGTSTGVPEVPGTSTGVPEVPSTSTGSNYSEGEPFFDAVQAGRWETAIKFLNKHPVVLRVRHPFSGKTALHIAVEAGHVDIVKELVSLMARDNLEIKSTWDGRTALHIAVEAGHVDIVKELVSLMEKDDLEIKSTRDGRTALAIAAIKGNTEMAECMVKKNENLLRIPDAFNDIPLVLAYLYGHWHMARYLYSVTPAEDLMPDRGPHGAAIISNCFPSKEFDISWNLINRCPILAFTSNIGVATPLQNLARRASSFRSGVQLNFWQQLIYDSIDIQPPPRINHNSVAVQNEENSRANNGRRSIRSVGGLVEQLVSHSKKQKEGLVSKIVEILGINRIYEMKIVHVNSLAFLKLVCEEINKGLDMHQISYTTVNCAIFEAVRNGNVEFITHICKANPELLWATNSEGRCIFHFAIECRQEKIYNLLYGISAKERVMQCVDTKYNNKLHMAGLLSPSAQAQLNRIPGAALQMQRELQWYKVRISHST